MEPQCCHNISVEEPRILFVKEYLFFRFFYFIFWQDWRFVSFRWRLHSDDTAVNTGATSQIQLCFPEQNRAERLYGQPRLSVTFQLSDPAQRHTITTMAETMLLPTVLEMLIRPHGRSANRPDVVWAGVIKPTQHFLAIFPLLIRLIIRILLLLEIYI